LQENFRFVGSARSYVCLFFRIFNDEIEFFFFKIVDISCHCRFDKNGKYANYVVMKDLLMNGTFELFVFSSFFFFFFFFLYYNLFFF
jgi:hypothetical protein